MAKIDLTSRINGDFIVLREAEPVYGDNGKKKLRWVCKCTTCHEKEVVSGESIRRGTHKLCSSCLRTDESKTELEKTVEKINRSVVAAGYKPITARQFINMAKFIRGNLAPEDEADLPEFVDKCVFLIYKQKRLG